MVNRDNNLRLDQARVRVEKLTDGSKVYDVVQRTLGGTDIEFACPSEAHATALVMLLNECCDITVE